MSDAIWYYVDNTQQRHGPVSAEAIAEAYRAGNASDGSLVWREGLPEWMPLSGYRQELGLVAAPVLAAEPATNPVASQRPSERPSVLSSTAAPAKSGKGCLVVGLVVGGILLVGFIAFLMAVALPAYREYSELAEAAGAGTTPDDTTTEDATTDTESPDTGPAVFGTPVDAGLIAAALAEARLHQGLVDEFVSNTDRCPRDSSEVAIPPATSAGVVAITVGEASTGMCTIEVELGGSGLESLSGERLTLSRDIAGDWYCTSGIADRDSLPEDCR